MSTQIQLAESKPTSQDIEKALIDVVKTGLYYRRPKEGKFMQSYKERIKKLRQAEDPEEYVQKLAQTILPNEDKYNKIMGDYKQWYGNDPEILNAIMALYRLYHRIAKDYFNTKAQVDKEVKDFLLLI